MSKTIGRLLGKDRQGHIVVRVDHRVMPEFGALWVIDDLDKETPERFFVRVVDTMFATDPGDASPYAKTLLDNPEMSVNQLDKEYIGFNFAIVDILGMVEGGHIVDFYRIPSILALVREPNSDEYALVVK